MAENKISIGQITDYLEMLAPLSSQEDYDNSGLIVGVKENEVKGILITLDCTEEVVLEAIKKGCNLIVAHHPIVFKALKKFNAKNYVEKTIMTAIKNDIAIYAAHTNLDNSLHGVNREISNRLNLTNLQILSPKETVLNKLVVFVPIDYAETVKNAMFEAGAGHIGNYQECSFSDQGIGTFTPLENTHPFIGQHNKRSEVNEIRLEMIVSSHVLSNVIAAMKNVHPYEVVAYDVFSLMNANEYEGAGMLGELKEPLSEIEFLKLLKDTFGCGCVKHTKLLGKKIQKVAVCGGSGSFLMKDAIRAQADIYVTADIKYHEFFDAEDRIVVADIGHYESEKFTIDLFIYLLKEKFSNFAILKTEVNTNPVNYFI